MVIVIHNTFLNEQEPGNGEGYISEVINNIARQEREHSFILLQKNSPTANSKLPANVTTYPRGPKKQTPLSWLYWYNFKAPLLLRKLKTDVFVTNNFCSFTIRIPQCLLLSNLLFLQEPPVLKKSQLSFYKKYTPRFLKRSASIITVSEFARNICIDKYKINKNKIRVAYTAANESFHPISYLEKEQVKAKYANENEYFASIGTVSDGSNLINLLKAFSAFKKRQKSSMQLLIASGSKITDVEFIVALRTFKFRDEVKVLEDLDIDEHSKILAAAWGTVHVSPGDNFGTSLFNAMKCEVPIVTSSTAPARCIVGDAALFANAGNFKEIAVQMMLLFKDEKLRKNLIEKGKKQLEQFNWQHTANNVWECIQKAVDH